MTEATAITNRLLVEIPKRWPARAWRRNVGGAYGVAVVQRAIEHLRRRDMAGALEALVHSRPIIFGQPGEADIDGIVSINGYGVRLAVEVKAGRDRLSREQESYLDMVRLHGGIALVARDVEACLVELSKCIEEASKPHKEAPKC